MIKKKYIISVVSLLLLIMFLQSFLSMKYKNLAYDDPAAINFGYYYLTTHDPRMLSIHPPLAWAIGAFPLLFVDINYPYTHPECLNLFPYACSNEFIFNSNNDIEKISFLAKIPFIIVSLILGFFIFLFSKKLYGIKAGFFSLLLYTFSPNILGFSTMIFTDLVVALFIFLTIYFLWKTFNKMSWWNISLTGLFLGLALVSKFIAIFLLPIIVLLMILKLYNKSKHGNITQRNEKIKLIKKHSYLFLTIVLVAFLVMNFIYFFQFDSISNAVPERFIERGFDEFEKKYPEGTFMNKAAHLVLEKIKFPLPSYLGGFIGQTFLGTSSTIKAYLNGEIFTGGRWYYFFEELAIRLPIPLLIFLTLSIFFFKRLRSKNLLNEFFIIIPMVVFILIYLLSDFSFQFRYLLPVFPFIFIFSGRIINLKFKHKNIFYLITAILIIWYITSSLLIFPHYMSYFNEFVMPQNGHKYILDHELGQDLKLLKNYMEKNNVNSIKLSYHGTFDPKYYNINYEALPMEFYIPWVEGYAKNLNELKNYTEDCSAKLGLIAISLSNYYNIHLLNESCFNWLYNYEPIERIGYTIYVFNITETPIK